MEQMLHMGDESEERATLACCIQSKIARARAREVLTSRDFWYPVNEVIWDAMERLDRQGKDVDAVSVMSVLRAGAGADQYGSTYQVHKNAMAEMPTLVTYPVHYESVATHADSVRAFAVRRRLYDEVKYAEQLVLNPQSDVMGMSASIATRFAGVRDAGNDEGIESMTLDEIMLEVPEEPDWLIPGFLERGDRFFLTAGEGAGKSHWTRQVAIMASAGLEPFRPWKHIRPVKGMIIDFENSKRQIRRRTEATYAFAVNHGKGAAGMAPVLNMGRVDITTDRVLNKIHRELDYRQPEILAIGPLYKMSPKALQTDDEAGPVLAALDTIRERGIALLIEAHAGHTMGQGRKRDLRPRGSSALMGWPEFGYGMTRTGERNAVLAPWRGDRDERDFPLHLVENGWGWQEERAMTAKDMWRPKQNWDDLERDDE